MSPALKAAIDFIQAAPGKEPVMLYSECLLIVLEHHVDSETFKVIVADAGRAYEAVRHLAKERR